MINEQVDEQVNEQWIEWLIKNNKWTMNRKKIK